MIDKNSPENLDPQSYSDLKKKKEIPPTDNVSNNNVVKTNLTTIKPVEKPEPKPLKPEEKPFKVFINEHLIPGLNKALKDKGFEPKNLTFKNGERPVVGGLCWFIESEFKDGRRFWICFSEEKITSLKSISLAEIGSQPSLLESFLIDEKKTTLQLIISRTLQRLNGQKWIGKN